VRLYITHNKIRLFPVTAVVAQREETAVERGENGRKTPSSMSATTVHALCWHRVAEQRAVLALVVWQHSALDTPRVAVWHKVAFTVSPFNCFVCLYKGARRTKARR
jgi:hypothetical protein